MGPVERYLNESLQAEYTPSELLVENTSPDHYGHVGDDGSGESHFKVTIKSDKLNELSRLERSRKILKHAYDNPVAPIHAIELKIL